MKKIYSAIFLFCIMLIGLNGKVFAQTRYTLDEAVQKSAQDIQEKLARGVGVAVYKFDSPTEKFSRYVLDGMERNFVNGRKLDVLDRKETEVIGKELEYQMSGHVGDDKQRRAGNQEGAYVVITGSLEDMGSYFIISFKAIEIESRKLQASPSFRVIKDKTTDVLLSGASVSRNTARKVSTPNDDWRNKKLYIGGWGGFGQWYYGIFNYVEVYDSYYGRYVDHSYYELETYPGAVIGLKVELSVAQYFSIDFDFGFEMGKEGLGLEGSGFAPCGDILLHIPFRFEFGLDIGLLGGIYGGDPAYIGFMGGASLGYKAGNGIIFIDAVYLKTFLGTDDLEGDCTGFIIRMGYKFGVGKRN